MIKTDKKSSPERTDVLIIDPGKKKKRNIAYK
jgi:hypothetical protein